MIAAVTPPRFRRIVVALDASPQSLAALEVAVALAARLEAELTALHVVDAELVKLAELPLAREIDYFSGEPRPIRTKGLERQLALYAGRAREGLESAVRGLEIRWSFHTAQGRPQDRLREFAGEADLLILGARGRSYGRGPGSTVKALAAEAGVPLMVVGPARRRGEAVHVVHDGTAAADEAVALAAALQSPGSRGLIVLATGGTEGLAERLRERTDVALDVRPVPGGTEGLAGVLARELPEVLVVPRPLVREPESTLTTLLRRGGCPVLVVG
jgi:nucleotide-binding universal stress UspA family protein